MLGVRQHAVHHDAEQPGARRPRPVVAARDVHRRRGDPLRARRRVRGAHRRHGPELLRLERDRQRSAARASTTRDNRLRTAGRVIPEMHVRLYDPTTAQRVEPATAAAACPRARARPRRIGYYEDDERQRQAVHRRRLDADGRRRRDRRRRLAVASSAARQRLHHPRRQEHQRPGGRGRGRHPPRGVDRWPRCAMPDPVFGERVAVYVELAPGGHDSRSSDLRSPPRPRVACRKEWYPRVPLRGRRRCRASSGGKVAKGELKKDAARRAADAHPAN